MDFLAGRALSVVVAQTPSPVAAVQAPAGRPRGVAAPGIVHGDRRLGTWVVAGGAPGSSHGGSMEDAPIPRVSIRFGRANRAHVVVTILQYCSSGSVMLR